MKSSYFGTRQFLSLKLVTSFRSFQMQKWYDWGFGREQKAGNIFENRISLTHLLRYQDYQEMKSKDFTQKQEEELHNFLNDLKKEKEKFLAGQEAKKVDFFGFQIRRKQQFDEEQVRDLKKLREQHERQVKAGQSWVFFGKKKVESIYFFQNLFPVTFFCSCTI